MAVVADSDSRWKWGLHTARQLLPDAEVVGYLIDGPATPSERQRAEVQIPVAGVHHGSLERIVTSLGAEPARVIVLALPGGATQAALHGLAPLWPGTGRRPVVVTGYVGVVYEKLLEGLLGRCGADVILANSAHDAERFRVALAGVGADASAVAQTVLPFLSRLRRPARGDHPFTVTFAAQPGVPGSRADREYVLQRLIRHATLHPEREVLIKLRGKAGEALTHAEPHPYPAIAPQLGVQRPPNLGFGHGDMGQTLDRTDLLVTVSSTAALEAMHRSLPTALITDFGIREGLGNHYFTGAGCYASFDDLDAGRLPVAGPAWTGAHGIGPGHTAEAARARVAELLEAELPPLRPFQSRHNTPVQLRRLLHRHGLHRLADDHDEPDDGTPSVPQLLRHAVRVVARSAYHQGVHTVAPALRRWARL